MKYKVGDRVRIVSEWGPGCCENSHGEMDHWLGKVMTIRSTDYCTYYMEEDYALGENDRCGWAWSENCIAELVPEFCKDDVCSGDIVVTRNGHTYMVLRNYGTESIDAMLGADCDSGFMDFRLYDDSLYYFDNEWDIVEVRRSTCWNLLPTDELCQFETVYKEVKRMTIQEAIDILSQYFGCPVEIKEEAV